MQAVDILHYFTAYLLKCKTTLSYSKRYDTTVLHNIDFTNKVTCLVAVIMFNVPSVITITMENVSVPSHQFLYISILFIHHTVIQKLLYLTPWRYTLNGHDSSLPRKNVKGWKVRLVCKCQKLQLCIGNLGLAPKASQAPQSPKNENTQLYNTKHIFL